MQDLTKGPIARHIIQLAVPIAIGMLVQTLYYLVDLYFVGQLGATALAAVSAAGNAAFLVLALTQILSVGTVALISQAVGRKDQQTANRVFNQSLFLALVTGVSVVILGYWLAAPYLYTITSDGEVISLGLQYLYWFIPGLALQFALVAMGSALRGTGIVKPAMLVQLISLVLNIILTPILIAGWGTGIAFGVAGAAMASSISVLVAVGLMWFYFVKLENYVVMDASATRPDWAISKKIIGIGFPAGGEFLLMFCYMGIIYWAIQQFGANAQAGFGLGSRIMQAVFLPALAIAFALPSMVGQNYGAGEVQRVKASFKVAATMNIGIMALLTIFCVTQTESLLMPFSDDPEVLAVAVQFLQLIAFNFVTSGLIFTCSGMFQGLGNAWPSFISTSSRLVMFAVPTLWLASQPRFEIETIWYLSIASVFVQALISLYLVKKELARRLPVETVALEVS